MSGPISPKVVESARKIILPEEVFEAFNETIAKHWNGHSAEFKQDEVVDLLLTKFRLNKKDIVRQVVFDNHWLDIELIYRKKGWKVDHDKPGYCEIYDATFTFKK